MNAADKSSWLITLTYWDFIMIHRRLLYRLIKHSSVGPVHPGCVGHIIVSFRVTHLHQMQEIFQFLVYLCFSAAYVNIPTARSNKNHAATKLIKSASSHGDLSRSCFQGWVFPAGQNFPVKDGPVEIHEDAKVRRKIYKSCLWMSDHKKFMWFWHVCLHLYDVTQAQFGLIVYDPIIKTDYDWFHIVFWFQSQQI